MLHDARGLAASPPVLYKFMVGRRMRLPFLLCGAAGPAWPLTRLVRSRAGGRQRGGGKVGERAAGALPVWRS